MNKKAITVWKNGTFKQWSKKDAEITRDDKDWLTEIPVNKMSEEREEMNVEKLYSFMYQETGLNLQPFKNRLANEQAKIKLKVLARAIVARFKEYK